MRHKEYHTEHDLWQAFLSDDKDAFACLFDRYSDAMYAYGRKITADSELVKDTIQDVFVKLYNNRANLSHTGSIKGYLFVALKRSLINQFHNRLMLSIEEESDVQFEIELMAHKSFEEEDSSYDEEQKICLQKALRELTSRQREAIYLYYIQEIPLNEIPGLLGMNYQSTRNLLHRAMIKLRQSVGVTSSVNMSLLLFRYLSE